MGEKWPIAYACYNDDLDIRIESTSGGIFTSIAAYLITRHAAVVYGASFDNDYRVSHCRCRSISDLGKLRGSKYPQSNLGDTFFKVKRDLDSGETVLFVGTPCQVEGLLSYIGSFGLSEKLYTMDFVCHGVASPGIWNDNIRTFSKENGPIRKVVFKQKLRGWKKWYVNIEAGNRTYRRRGIMDPFMRSYLQYDNIRPSCYRCRFKGLERKSDFTISDCWGIGEADKELNDDKGLSALLLHNPKALEIFDDIKDGLSFREYDAELLMKGNWTATRSVTPGKKRDRFFKAVKEYGGYYSVKKYYSPTVIDWLWYYIKRGVGKEK